MSLDKVTEIIAKFAKCRAEDIKPESELAALGLTSLDTITVLFEFEEAFDIEIPNEVIPSIVTVRDILEKMSAI
ncbi:MAG: phosphopantetheine-binding protein [Gammaproteobacteria bacterium]|nr:phosphopantetheine-binding protein [Gammaproteobacteria bacterium]